MNKQIKSQIKTDNRETDPLQEGRGPRDEGKEMKWKKKGNEEKEKKKIKMYYVSPHDEYYNHVYSEHVTVKIKIF